MAVGALGCLAGIQDIPEHKYRGLSPESNSQHLHTWPMITASNDDMSPLEQHYEKLGGTFSFEKDIVILIKFERYDFCK